MNTRATMTASPSQSPTTSSSSEPIEHRIWLDVDADIYATVSFEDYAWAIQWRWQITWDRHKRKAYATRSTKTHGGRRVKYYLHKEVLKRSMKLPPSKWHTMGDHGDGNSLHCQRWNLEWATPAQNRATARSAARGRVEPEQAPEIPY